MQAGTCQLACPARHAKCTTWTVGAEFQLGGSLEILVPRTAYLAHARYSFLPGMLDQAGAGMALIWPMLYPGSPADEHVVAKPQPSAGIKS